MRVLLGIRMGDLELDNGNSRNRRAIIQIVIIVIMIA